VPSINLVLQVAPRNADRGAGLPETARFLVFRKAVGVVKATDQTEDGMQDSKVDPGRVVGAILELDFDRGVSNLLGVEAVNRPKEVDLALLAGLIAESHDGGCGGEGIDSEVSNVAPGDRLCHAAGVLLRAVEVDIVARHEGKLAQGLDAIAVVREPVNQGLAANQHDRTARQRRSEELEGILKCERRLVQNGREGSQ
jgi:hypothetical protein